MFGYCALNVELIDHNLFNMRVYYTLNTSLSFAGFAMVGQTSDYWLYYIPFDSEGY